MILLIKFSKVIALHVTRALASAIRPINGVCECGCDFRSVCVELSLPHSHTDGLWIFGINSLI